MRSFYEEWFAIALAAAAIAAFAMERRKAPLSLPELSLWLAAFAGWLAIQAALRDPAYFQLPLAGVLFTLLAALLAALGRGLASRLGEENVVDAIASTVLLAAFGNAAIGIVQFYGVPELLSGVFASSAGAVVGHIGQRNLFADFIGWGEASLLYLLARGRLRDASGLAAGAVLALAAAYSQSRSAVLFSAWLAAAAALAGGRLPLWGEMRRRALLLFVFTLAIMLLLPLVHALLGVERGPFALERIVEETPRIEVRPAAWALALRLFWESPWLGTGWGEFAGAAFSIGLPAPLATMTPIWSSPHNTPLQILAEAGLAGALIAVAAALRWGLATLRRLRAEASPTVWWSLACVGIVAIHSLLEYPLWYAHFLCLAALAAGVVAPPVLAPPAWLRPASLAFAALCAVLLAWALRDYSRFDRAALIATGRTLAPAAETRQSLEDLRDIAAGPLGAEVAPWLYRWSPEQPGDRWTSREAGQRALRRLPDPGVVERLRAQATPPLPAQ